MVVFFYISLNWIMVTPFTLGPDELHLKPPLDHMKLWGLGRRTRVSKPRREAQEVQGRLAEGLGMFLSESALPSSTWDVPKEWLCSQGCATRFALQGQMKDAQSWKRRMRFWLKAVCKSFLPEHLWTAQAWTFNRGLVSHTVSLVHG